MENFKDKLVILAKKIHSNEDHAKSSKEFEELITEDKNNLRFIYFLLYCDIFISPKSPPNVQKLVKIALEKLQKENGVLNLSKIPNLNESIELILRIAYCSQIFTDKIILDYNQTNEKVILN